MSLLELVGITKVFPGVVALKGVNFSCEAGEIHGLVGENGSGKSTLVNIIGGVYKPEFGQIFLRGKEVSLSSPASAMAMRISILRQELLLAENVSVAENILMGQMRKFRANGLLSWSRMQERTAEILRLLGHMIDPATKVGTLQHWEKRIVQISKALANDSVILALDEPTSTLSSDDSHRLFDVMRNLKKNGIGIIFVTHKLDEALAICDRITVLRDGKVVDTVRGSDIQTKDVIRMMTGKEVDFEQAPEARKLPETEAPLLEAVGITTNLLKDVTIRLYAGKIVGLVGLVGSGKTELIRAVLGLDPVQKGTIRLRDKVVALRSMHQAKRLGFGYLPDDRRSKGLVIRMTIRENITLPILSSISRVHLMTNEAKEKQITLKWMQELGIAARSSELPVVNLSGGTQQKVVIAKWLADESTVLLCDEPTVGVDVAARIEIHRIFRRLAATGKAILWSTSDLDDALDVCDRIIVMRKGEIVNEFSTALTSKAAIMNAIVAGDSGNV